MSSSTALSTPIKHTYFYGVEENSILTGEWLDEWGARKINSHARTTKKNLLYSINDIKKYLGSYPLQELNTFIIQDWVNTMVSENRSPGTIHRLFDILNISLRAACRRKYLGYNPCLAVKRPVDRMRQRGGITHEEFHALTEQCKGTKYENFVPVKAYAALRSGEIFGLSWRQVDFEHGKLLIDQQLLEERLEHGRNYFIEKGTKTRFIREIWPPEETFEYLNKEKAKQDAYKAANPDFNNPDDLVFTDKNGATIKKSSNCNMLARYCEKAGIPVITLHDLRHYGAVLKYEKTNYDLWAVKAFLGHKHVKMTIFYLYTTIQQMTIDASKIEEFYAPYLRDA